MSRWQPNARSRREQAALQLFLERRYDRTTVAEIAERAGLTERTFFRHFATVLADALRRHRLPALPGARLRRRTAAGRS